MQRGGLRATNVTMSLRSSAGVGAVDATICHDCALPESITTGGSDEPERVGTTELCRKRRRCNVVVAEAHRLPIGRIIRRVHTATLFDLDTTITGVNAFLL